MFYNIEIKSRQQTEFLDITSKVKEVVHKSRIEHGICCVYVPHTTAGITINENADPSVVKDMLKELNKIVPFNDNYEHLEGNSAAHIKSSLMGSSQSIIINDGELVLGTWQGIYFCEFDGPRYRKVYIKIIKG